MHKFDVIKQPTDIHGLKYLPQLNGHNNDADIIFWDRSPSKEFSNRDADILRSSLLSIREKCKCIVEIGVCRNGQDSSTFILLNEKLPNCIYLGIDVEDKSFLNNPEKNIYTIRTNSLNRDLVWAFLENLGIQKIDFLFIDGLHSVNMMLNDWQYTVYLSDFGVVVMHDTTVHPGPQVVFDAIDENIYEKVKYFDDIIDDWGIAVAKRNEKI